MFIQKYKHRHHPQGPMDGWEGYLEIAGISYPPLMLSGPTGTAAVSCRRGLPVSFPSASNASYSSGDIHTVIRKGEDERNEKGLVLHLPDQITIKYYVTWSGFS